MLAENATFGDLLTFVLPQGPAGRSFGTSTAGYSAHSLLATDEHLHISTPASGTSFPQRAVDALRLYLKERGLLDTKLPDSLRNAIAKCQQQVKAQRDATTDTLPLFLVLAHLISPVWDIVHAVTDADPESNVTVSDPGLPHAQSGNINLVTQRNGRTVASTAVKVMKPSVHHAHAAGMATSTSSYSCRGYPGGPSSILFKLFLHMYHCCFTGDGVPTSLGMIFSGTSVQFAESYELDGRHGLAVSKLYDCSSVTDGAPHEVVPIIALLVAISIPDLHIPPPTVPESLPISLEEVFPPVATLIHDLGPSGPVRVRTERTASDLPQNVQLRIATYGSGTKSVVAPSIATLPSSPALSVQTLYAYQRLHNGPEATTWRVQLVATESKFVAKVFSTAPGMWDQACGEAGTISTVRERCGDVTPRLLGVYRWEGDEGALMLQEDGGASTSKSESFSGLSQADKAAMWDLVLRLHGQGIEHGDIKPDNFVRAPDGVIRILDFGRSDVDHQCPGAQSCEELRFLKSSLSR